MPTGCTLAIGWIPQVCSDAVVDQYSWDAPKDPINSEVLEHLPDTRSYARLRTEVSALTAAVAEDEPVQGNQRDRDWISLSDTQERLGRFEAAAASARSLGERQGGSRPELTAEASVRLARLHVRRGDWTTARGILCQRLEIAEHDGDGPSLSRLLTGLAAIEISREELVEALRLLDRAFAVARSSRSTFEKGQALAMAGAVFAIQRDFIRARGILSRAALLHQRCRDLESLGRTYNNIGVTFHMESRFTEAIPYVELGLSFVSARADLLVVLNCLNNNIRVFEDLELAGAHQYRGPMRALVTELPNRRIGRMTDRTFVPLAYHDVERTPASFGDEPFISHVVICMPPLSEGAPPPSARPSIGREAA
jgi:tetratricopeptide (TPR) repeat protein